MIDLQEDIFFFKGSNNRLLLGFLHKPKTVTPSLALIYCHPFAEEKNMAHAVSVRTARRLAQQGILVMRFDLSGCGDSEGELEEIELTDWLEDIDKAIQFIREQFKIDNYGLWGLRFGASLSLLYETEADKASFMVLWQPIFNLKTYMEQILKGKVDLDAAQAGKGYLLSHERLRDRLNQQKVIFIKGYPISQSLYNGCYNIGELDSETFSKCPMIIFSLSLMDHPNLYLDNYIKRVQIKNSLIALEHLKVEPFWDRYWKWKCIELETATGKWIDRFIGY